LLQHTKCPFKRKSDLSDQSVIEQPAQYRDPVWHPTRRIELRERIRRIGCPITSRFGDIDKPGAQGERGMPGEVTYG
jgi:hypothetical protein